MLLLFSEEKNILRIFLHLGEVLNMPRTWTRHAFVQSRLSCTRETCLSKWRALIGPEHTGSTSADWSVYVVGVPSLLDWRVVRSMPGWLWVLQRRQTNQSKTTMSERFRGVTNHWGGRKNLLTVWWCHAKFNLMMEVFLNQWQFHINEQWLCKLFPFVICCPDFLTISEWK